MHPSEATLLALVHGELAPGAAAGVRAHLAACSACFAAASELQRLDGEIGALLVELDHPVPRLRPPAVAPRPHRLRRAAIAAATALLAAGIAAAAVPGTSLHRWVQDRLEIARPRAAMAPTGRRTPADEQAGGRDRNARLGHAHDRLHPTAGVGILTVAVAERPVGEPALVRRPGGLPDRRGRGSSWTTVAPPGVRASRFRPAFAASRSCSAAEPINALDGSRPASGPKTPSSLSNAGLPGNDGIARAGGGGALHHPDRPHRPDRAHRLAGSPPRGAGAPLVADLNERVTADTGDTRPKAIDYSDAYGTRLAIHRYASYTELPRFALLEYVLGEKILNGQRTRSARVRRHALGAQGRRRGPRRAVPVNTVTGVWNLIEARHDPAGRTRRNLHALTMLLADVGCFCTTASLAGYVREGEGDYELAQRNLPPSRPASAWRRPRPS